MLYSLYFAATLLKTEQGTLPEGKVRIKLEHDGTVLEVDEDDVEKVRLKAFSFPAIWLGFPCSSSVALCDFMSAYFGVSFIWHRAWLTVFVLVLFVVWYSLDQRHSSKSHVCPKCVGYEWWWISYSICTKLYIWHNADMQETLSGYMPHICGHFKGLNQLCMKILKHQRARL